MFFEKAEIAQSDFECALIGNAVVMLGRVQLVGDRAQLAGMRGIGCEQGLYWWAKLVAEELSRMRRDTF